jgi:hypothetical protein
VQPLASTRAMPTSLFSLLRSQQSQGTLYPSAIWDWPQMGEGQLTSHPSELAGLGQGSPAKRKAELDLIYASSATLLTCAGAVQGQV